MTNAVLQRQDPAATAALAAPTEAVGDSMTVALWTAISRATGVARGVVIAAVLGATLFANTYQFTSTLPQLVFYGFLGGSMLSSLLIPALARHIDAGDRGGAERVAGGFFGFIVLGMGAVIPLAVLLAPAAMHLATLGGAPSAETAEQARVGGMLILVLVPQVPLYGVIATASAAMYAKGRFALAAAAPAVENVGTVAVLALVPLLYPGIGTLEHTPTSALLLLGLGTTAAVGAHAALQWFGARRAGIRLRPRPGWRDGEVRPIIRRAVPSLIQAGLTALQLLVLLGLANRVAGGVVAFQLATNFFFLPIALGATPVALSLAPRLARMTGRGAGPAFRDTFVRGLGFALFVAVPAAAGYLAIAVPLARAVSYGGFSTDAGVALIAASVAALAIGIIGQAAFLVATYACYARDDTSTPLKGMLLQLGTCLSLASTALLVDGAAVLTVLGLALSAGTVVSAVYLVRAILRDLPPGEEPLGRPLARITAMSFVMSAPAYTTGTTIADWIGGGTGAVIGVASAAAVGAVVYFGGQALLGAPELTWVTGAWRRKPAADGELPGPADRMPLRGPVRQPGYHTGPLVNAALLLGCLAVGVLLAAGPVAAAGLLVLLGLAGWVFVRPAVAAYLLIFATPLVAGIDRGTVIPVLRPNEALALFLAAALGARWLLRLRTGGVRWPSLGRLDISLLAIAVCSSFVPLLMMVVREREITTDDLQHTIVLWKYLAVYAIVRSSISTAAQARRALVVSMAAASAVCLIGILQSLDLFGVPGLLATYYAPFGVERTLDIGRGSSTLALAAAVADLAILNLAIAVGMLLRGAKHRALLGTVVLLCVFGVLGAGEFSTVLGLVVGVAALIVLSGARRLIWYASVLAIVGGIVMWPVIEIRLQGFQSASGLPDSWIVRFHNLTTYFWPDLMADGNWVFGVRPAARVPAPHEEFGWVWIESGYTWLLWAGGLPLLGAYIYFVVVSLRQAGAAARRGQGTVGIVGLAVVAAVAANVVLMNFDPHLTYRGAADAMFGLLAILRVLDGDRSPGNAPAEKRGVT
jgi:murein biosynthesis integral membrane protein MurJ